MLFGVDISKDMIKQAKQIDSKGDYRLIRSAEIPFPDNSFDVIFLSYVFLEVGNFEEIIKILKEMKRVLKENGNIIIVTAIVSDIKNKWISFTYDFPENEKPLDKCQKLKLLIKDNNIIFYDYNWTDKEYREAIKEANLDLEKLHIPLGTKNDPYVWQDEKDKPYCYIYILKK